MSATAHSSTERPGVDGRPDVVVFALELSSQASREDVLQQDISRSYVDPRAPKERGTVSGHQSVGADRNRQISASRKE